MPHISVGGHAESSLHPPKNLLTAKKRTVPSNILTTAAPNHRPPAWFRYGIVAVATLILCSCRAIGPVNSALLDGSLAAIAQSQPAPHNDSAIVRSAGHENSARQQTLPPVVPAIYIQDTHTAPPAIHQAQYQERLRKVGYEYSPCQDCACATDSSTIGPRDEYLCDGGDYGTPAAVRKDWHLDGLQQEDTVAHYDTVDGRTVITPSNRVCIYAPRFGVVRREIDLYEYARYDRSVGINDTLALAKIDETERAIAAQTDLEPSIHRAENPPSLLRERQQSGELDQELNVAEFDGSLAPYADLQIIRLGTISNNEKVLVARASLAAITWTGDQGPQVTIDSQQAHAALGQRQAGVVYQQKDPTKPRLRLVKLASAGSAQPGEEIEFTLRFDNIGSQVMGNVTIVDHLTTRLEYVADSATASVEAAFSLQPGDSGGSKVLRWEIKEPLEAGKGGILQFKCKVL